MKTFFSTLMLALLALFFSTANAAAQAKDSSEVKDGSTVSLEYTLSGEDGALIESNKGKEPLRYVDGRSQIIPGLEKALEGLKVGAQKKVTVKPEDAYGPVDPSAFNEVPKDIIPQESLKVGTILMATNAQGEVREVRVHEIKEKTVVMDMNHPLAGKTLVFDIKILAVTPPATK
ncbi:MAG TPA: peptidylprolyl isomerase [Candidatus Binatia bacterium]